MSNIFVSPTLHNAPPFKGYLNIGHLRLGWVIESNRSAEWTLLREWRYATKHTEHKGVRIPFPVLKEEWEDLQGVFLKAGIVVPPREAEVAVKAIENSNLRMEMSHATKLDNPPVIPGLKGELFGFQDAGVLYARSMGWRSLIGDDMGLGKAQPLSSMIRLPGGKWCKMGDIRKGMRVSTPDYTGATVTDVYPQGVLKIYRVELFGGQSARACAEHLWEVAEMIDDCLSVTIRNTQSMIDSTSDIYLRCMDEEEEFPWVRVVNIVDDGEEEAQCIRIDHEDHLYITNDGIVTHNTIQGISCALMSESVRTLVVTRAVAVEGWHRSIRRFTDAPCRVGVGAAPVALMKRTGGIGLLGVGDFRDEYVPLAVKLPSLKEDESYKFDPEKALADAIVGSRGMDSGFLILNYDLLTKWENEIVRFNPDMLILDEAHAIKEPTSQRSQVAHKLMRETKMSVCLSGTPIPNRPKEFFYISDQLHPGKWGDWYKFAHRYCDAKQVVIGYDWKETGNWVTCRACGGKKCKQCNYVGKKKEKIREEKKAWDFNGSSNEKEMYERMRGFGMVRRMKDDVLNLMPPQQETIQLEATKRYRDVERGFLEVVKGQFNPLVNKKDEATMHQLFAAAAADKIEWAKTWLGTFLEDTEEKIVVFFHHQVVGEALAEWLLGEEVGFVRAFGQDKDKNVEQVFQTNKGIRVALCSYGVAREALTLTEASYMLCVEYAWVPGWMQQAMDRIRRIGQDRVCNYYFPVFCNSVEERIVNAFMQKQDVLSMIMQGEILRSVQVDI